MRIIFMGTPDFAVHALGALIESSHEVVAVYTQPPRPAGRGRGERRSPVHEIARAHELPVHTPVSLKDADVKKDFAALVAALGADIAVVAAYGLILPKAVLAAPAKGGINIHGSLLPRWRGAAPIQRAILAGDEKTGITIMQMDEGLDTGDILAMEEIAIGPATTADALHDQLAVLGAALVVSVLDRLDKGEVTATPQAQDGVCTAPKLSRAEGRLDWRIDATALERKVRAFTPWPGAWFELDGTRIKVLAAEIAENVENAAPGLVADGRLTIACGTGALRVLRAQREGRKAQSAEELLRGFAIPKGSSLSLPDEPGADGAP